MSLHTPLLSIDVDTWHHIAKYLTRDDLDALWACNNNRLNTTLLPRLKHSPPIAIQPRKRQWPSWMKYCQRLTHLNLTFSDLPWHCQWKCMSGKPPPTLYTLDNIKRRLSSFWHIAVQTLPTRTLESLQIDLSNVDIAAFYNTCDNLNRKSHSTTNTSIQDATTFDNSIDLRLSILDTIQTQFSNLTTLKVTQASLVVYEDPSLADKCAFRLEDWLLNSEQRESFDVEHIATPLPAMSSISNTFLTRTLYTLHLVNVAEYRPNTPLLMQHLPRTLTELQIVFLNYVQIEFDNNGNSVAHADQNMLWTEQTAVLPPNLMRLTLEGVPIHVLTPSVFASLRHLEYLKIDDSGTTPIIQTSTYELEKMPLAQLPSTLHTLELISMLDERMVAHMKSIHNEVALTMLTLQERRFFMSPSEDNMIQLNALIEHIVSDVKFQQLETLHIWTSDDRNITDQCKPSLAGMEKMRRLQSLSTLFLSPALHDQWIKHLPLPNDGSDKRLHIVPNPKCYDYIKIDEYCAHPVIAEQVFSNLHFDAIRLCTSRSDVQLHPNLASSIREVIIDSDDNRDKWMNAPLVLHSENTQPPERLNWVHSIQHLPSLIDITVNDECDFSHLQELNARPKFFKVLRSCPMIPESCFNFGPRTWTSNLVELKLCANVRVKNVTHFFQSLPSTLESIDLFLLSCEDDPHEQHRHQHITTNYFSTYEAASEEECLKREIRFIPSQLKVCNIGSGNVYVTDATLLCLPRTLIVVQFLHILDVHFDPQTLFMLPPKLLKCSITTVFCSDPRLKDITHLKSHLWHKFPALNALRIELPMAHYLGSNNNMMEEEYLEEDL